MNYAVVTSSRTGNTKQLANVIQEVLRETNMIDVREEGKEVQNADILFVGFWTDKGTCSEEVKKLLHTLEGKKIFLFGTAGFGQSQTYFDQIIERVKKEIPQSNQVIGSYMCQGKMPITVRERYIKLQKEDPTNKQYEKLIQNFDTALSHPDQQDLEGIRKKVLEIVK